jgi:N-acetylglucosaminyldiphosphoundecaprenol N-acetyl-beta-D-mannosaminyltransferase
MPLTTLKTAVDTAGPTGQSPQSGPQHGPSGQPAPKAPLSRPWHRSPLLNVHVDGPTMQQFIAHLDEGVVFTLNPDHAFHLQRNQAFYDAYVAADYVTSDSKYVYWGLKLIGRPIPEKVSGSDIVPAYCNHHANNPAVRVFYLGAAPGIAEKARQRTNARCGREVAVGAHSPSMTFVNNEQEINEVIDIINRVQATCVIVGLGAPKQEIWIQKYKHRMPTVKVWMGVGATIDYEADAVKRAPRWMTRNGLEWVYRITTEPRRYWRRYARDLEYFWLLVVDGLGGYKNPMKK